jgi:hypothetical protein
LSDSDPLFGSRKIEKKPEPKPIWLPSRSQSKRPHETTSRVLLQVFLEHLGGIILVALGALAALAALLHLPMAMMTHYAI